MEQSPQGYPPQPLAKKGLSAMHSRRSVMRTENNEAEFRDVNRWQGRTVPASTRIRSIAISKQIPAAVLAVILSLTGFGCNKASGGQNVVDQEIDKSELKTLLGSYDNEKKGEFYKLDIKSDTIRCNHSNHKDEYTTHKYSVVRAKGGKFILVAKDGALKAEHNKEGGKWKFEAVGICSWGIDNPYTQTSKHTGDPNIGIHPKLGDKPGTSAGKAGEEVKLPWGTLTVHKAKVKTWEVKGKDVYALLVKATVKNTSKSYVELNLPSNLKSLGSTFASASCDGGKVDGTSLVNPNFKSHPEPKMFDGGGWASVRAPIGPGKKRKGWFAIALDDEADKECKLKLNMAALGGSVFEFTVAMK